MERSSLIVEQRKEWVEFETDSIKLPRWFEGAVTARSMVDSLIEAEIGAAVACFTRDRRRCLD